MNKPSGVEGNATVVLQICVPNQLPGRFKQCILLCRQPAWAQQPGGTFLDSLALGNRGQFSVEASGQRKGFLLGRTSFVYPSVSSQSTTRGWLRLHGPGKGSSALAPMGLCRQQRAHFCGSHHTGVHSEVNTLPLSLSEDLRIPDGVSGF